MWWFRAVPVAWHNLTFQPLSFLGYALGVGFAVVLMFVQYGMLHAFLDSNVALVKRMDADLVLVSPQRASASTRDPIPLGRVLQARSVPGVASVRPLYLEGHLAEIRNPRAAEESWLAPRGIRVIAIDPDAPEIHPADLGIDQATLARLRAPGAALFDIGSKPDPRHPGSTVFGDLRVGAETELAGKRIRIVGTFRLGSDSLADGTLLVSHTTFADYLRRPLFPGDPYEDVEFGLVRVADKSRIEEVRERLRAELPANEVEVVTLGELVERERAFWVGMTPIGWIFGFGAWVGFLVGLVVCTQILASDVSDHLPEYATLRAMGYTRAYLVWVVCEEAVYLTIGGFVPGLIVSWLVFQALELSTGLAMDLTPERIWAVFWRTVLMCGLAAVFAVTKAMRADPAEVFG
jgi:putative ABC transport system permease protein